MAMKRWTGSANTDVGAVKRWNGSQWVLCDFVKRWTGSAWVDVWRGITAYVSGYFNPTPAGPGGNQRVDKGVFTVGRSPSSAPAITAWQWDYSDYGGMLMGGGTTSSSLTLTGPQYSPENFPQSYQVDIWCTVTIGGVQYRSETLTAYYQGGFF